MPEREAENGSTLRPQVSRNTAARAAPGITIALLHPGEPQAQQGCRGNPGHRYAVNFNPAIQPPHVRLSEHSTQLTEHSHRGRSIADKRRAGQSRCLVRRKEPTVIL